MKPALVFVGKQGSMVEIVISSPAEQEYAEALCWYAERSMRAAQRFDDDFDQSIRLIAATPQRFAKCDDRHRFFLMRRFPYQLIYRSDAARLTVVAVAHTSREPNYWHGR